MGIKRLRKALKAYFPSVFIHPFNDKPTDWLYIDFNCVIHKCIRKARRGEKTFYQTMKQEVMRYINNTPPAEGLVLCIDGPAPWAKILLQRTRRKKGQRESKEESIPDSIEITPGAAVLGDIEEYCYYLSCNLIQKGLVKKVIISGSRVPGEGELKISDAMLRIDIVNPGCTHVVVGDDSDLILLCLLTGIPNVFLQLSYNLAISLDELKRVLTGSDPLPLLFGTLHPLCLDFGFLSLLNGNDYLPYVIKNEGRTNKFINIEYSNQYPKIRAALSDTLIRSDLSLNVHFLFHLLTKSAHLQNYKKHLKCTPTKRLYYYPHRIPQLKDHLPIATPKIKKVEAYLSTIMWCLEMYVYGSCQNYRKVYPYQKPPSMSNLIKYCLSKLHQKKKLFQIKYNKRDPLPVLPKDVMMVTMPLLSGSLLPKPLLPLFQKVSERIPKEIPPETFEETISEILELSKEVSEKDFDEKELLSLSFDEPKCITKRSQVESEEEVCSIVFTQEFILKKPKLQEITNNILFEDLPFPRQNLRQLKIQQPLPSKPNIRKPKWYQERTEIPLVTLSGEPTKMQIASANTIKRRKERTIMQVNQGEEDREMKEIDNKQSNLEKENGETTREGELERENEGEEEEKNVQTAPQIEEETNSKNQETTEPTCESETIHEHKKRPLEIENHVPALPNKRRKINPTKKITRKRNRRTRKKPI